jgi:hypothetical protein
VSSNTGNTEAARKYAVFRHGVWNAARSHRKLNTFATGQVDHATERTLRFDAMAIRFQCSACSQPIEIDDEWGEKAVACPYCRNTVTAPAESTLDDLATIPTANPIAPVAEMAAAAETPPALAHYPAMDPGAPAALGPQTGMPVRRNVPAIVSAIGTFAALSCVLGTFLVMMTNQAEIRELQQVMGSAPTIQESQDAMTELMNQNGGYPPGWLLAMSACGLGTIAFSLVGVVAGAFGVRIEPKRTLAIVSLVMSGMLLMMTCLVPGAGMLIQS